MTSVSRSLPVQLVRAVLVAAGLGLMVPGCMVGPDFERPEAPVAGQWSEGGPGITAGRKELVGWWKVFKDPVLNRLGSKAAKQNLSLELAGLRVMEARAQLAIAVGNAYPQVQQATGDLSYNRNPDLRPHPYFTAASVGFDASWELDLWGKYRRGTESARANLLANIAGYDDVLVSLTAEVARTYVMIREIEERIATAKQNIVTQTRSTEITKALWVEGAKGELDYQQAATTLYSTQASVPGLEISLKQAEHAMAILLGMPPQKMSGHLSGSKGIPVAPASIAAGIPSDLLRRRPDLRQAEFQAAAQCAQIGIAETDLKKSVDASQRALGGGWQAAKPATYIPARVRKQMEDRTNWGDMLGSPADRPPASAPSAAKRTSGKSGG